MLGEGPADAARVAAPAAVCAPPAPDVYGAGCLERRPHNATRGALRCTFQTVMPTAVGCRYPAARHMDQEARRPVAIAVHYYDVEEAGFGIWIVRPAGAEQPLSVQTTRAEAIGVACAVAKTHFYERESGAGVRLIHPPAPPQVLIRYISPEELDALWFLGEAYLDMHTSAVT